MSGIFSKPKIPPPPQIKDPAPMPTAGAREVRLASQRAIATRMKKSGRAATALSDEKAGL